MQCLQGTGSAADHGREDLLALALQDAGLSVQWQGVPSYVFAFQLVHRPLILTKKTAVQCVSRDLFCYVMQHLMIDRT